jgi:hypothetical protein
MHQKEEEAQSGGADTSERAITITLVAKHCVVDRLESIGPPHLNDLMSDDDAFKSPKVFPALFVLVT